MGGAAESLAPGFPAGVTCTLTRRHQGRGAHRPGFQSSGESPREEQMITLVISPGHLL